MIKKITLFSAMLLTLVCTVFTHAQTVDSSFGMNGYLPYGAGGNNEDNAGCGNNSVIQPDGKIVTAISKNAPNVNGDLNIWTYRYNPDGTPDMPFGVFGASGIFAGDQSKNKDIKIQPDGKIVLIGETEYCILGVCGAPQFIMMRLNADGTKDTTFGTNGEIITTDIFDTAGLYAIGERVFLASNGKYIIAGKGIAGHPFVARLNNDGSKDLSFGVDGVYSDTAVYAILKDIAIDDNENIYGLLLNYGSYDTTNLSDNTVFKLNSQGLPDPAFHRQLMNVSNRDMPSSIDLRNDGKVVIAGSTRPGYSNGYGIEEFGYIIILNDDGTVSTIFPQGYERINISGDSATFIYKVKVIDGDKMLLSGKTISKNTTGNYEEKAFISCLDSYGNLFPSFNSTGFMKFDYGAHSSIGSLACFYDLDLLPSGELFATGYRNPVAHSTSISLFILKLVNTNLTSSVIENQAFQVKTKLFPNTSAHPTLEFDLPSATHISLRLLSFDGRIICTFADNQFLQQGDYSKELIYPSGLAKGMYYLSLECSNGATFIQKVVLTEE
jgi:uncharacterized delta-60 repeat protein